MAEISARERRETEDFEAQRERKIRRTGPLTLFLLIVLLVLVGWTTAIDMRRLNTPGGTALSWVEAATFGDCTRYRELSVRPDDERRSAGDVCTTLRERTKTNRDQQQTIVVRLIGSRSGEATVDVERIGQPTKRAEVNLVKRDGRWRVVLDHDTCDPVGCA